MSDFKKIMKMINIALKGNDYNDILNELISDKKVIPANESLKLATIIEICHKHNYKVEIGTSFDNDNLINLESYIDKTDGLDQTTSSILDLQKNLNGNQLIFTNQDQTNTVIFYQINTGDN